MSVFMNALVNVWRLVRNARVRLFGRPPDFVWIEVSGALPEFAPRAGFLWRRLRPGPAAPSLEGIRERFDRISGDGRPRGVVLRLRDLDAGWATLEELRREIDRYRDRGGRVIAYFAGPAETRSYFVASAADEIFATPVATVNVTGVRARVNFLRDALERVGIGAEVVAVSPYKSAGDRFVRNDFSREGREQAERLLDRRYGAFVEAVARGRGLSPEAVREKVDGAPYGTRAAVPEGLLDGVLYEDEVPGRLRKDGGRARVAEWEAARGALKVPYRRRVRRRVGVVGLSGTIVRGTSRRLPVPLPLVGGEQAGSDSVVGALRAAERDRRVAAVLFHVDSGGGDALASDLIWREVQRIRAKKPVVVLMGDAAASGGYYVSAAANHVFARENTVTGSIGVITIRPVAAGLYGKLGVNPVSVERGAHAGLLDESRRPTEEELRVVKEQVGFFYGEFKDRVANGRNLDPSDLEGIAGGRVWTGAEARGLGLVDSVGGFREALEKARELGGVEQDVPEALLKVSPPRGVRPAPGDPPTDPAEAVRWAVGVVGRAISEARGGGTWALAPYEISDGW